MTPRSAPSTTAKRYSVGVDWKELEEGIHCLFASPEKALADIIARERDIRQTDEMLEHLIDNLRIDEDALSELDLIRMGKIAASYRNPVVRLLADSLMRMS